MLNVTSADITGSLSIKIKKERGGFERNDLSHCSIKWANDLEISTCIDSVLFGAELGVA